MKYKTKSSAIWGLAGIFAVFSILFGLITYALSWPIPVLIFLVPFLLLLWLLLLRYKMAVLTTDEAGITQRFAGQSWSFAWKDIDDWSFLEIEADDDSWSPCICLSTNGRVNITYPMMITLEQGASIAAELATHCGPPKNRADPVLPIWGAFKLRWREPQITSPKQSVDAQAISERRRRLGQVTDATTHSKRNNVIWASIFVVVISVGAFLSLKDIIPDYLFWWQMRGAVPVMGAVTSIDPEDYCGDLEIRVSYSYKFNGLPYTGSRARVISSPIENDAALIWSLRNRLASARERGETITVYVNPRDPHVSALDRTVTNADAAGGPFCLIMFFLLGGIAVYGLVLTLRGKRQ